MNYLDLEFRILERLDVLAFRFNQPEIIVRSEYQHRNNNLRVAYNNEYDKHKSKFMFKAYEGTIRYFEGKK